MIRRQASPGATGLLCPDLDPVREEHRNPWFRVMNRGGFFTLEYDRPQVVILPVVEDDGVVLVRVRRPVIGDCPLELPAGDSQPGETLAEAARRELTEETGLHIEDLGRFRPLRPISEMPGRMPVLLGIFRVDVRRGEFAARRPFDAAEIQSVELVPVPDLVSRIVAGEIYLSSPMAILARFVFEWQRERERATGPV